LAVSALNSRTNGLWDAHKPEYVLRLNYGVAATKTGTACVVEGYVTHTFHIALPDIMQERTKTRNGSNVCVGNICRKMLGVYQAMQELKDSTRRAVTSMIMKVHSLVPDVRGPIRRFSRGLIDGIGIASSWLFGTATSSEVQDLSKEIGAIKALAGTAAADAARTKEGMVTYTKVTNQRLDGLHQLMAEDHKALNDVIDSVHRIADIAELEYNVIALMASELSRFVALHDSVQTLELKIWRVDNKRRN
jgi:hypothetical protein